MRIWRKTAQKESSGRGLARAALDAASRQELLQEAMKALARNGPTDRLGVWRGTVVAGTPPRKGHTSRWSRPFQMNCFFVEKPSNKIWNLLLGIPSLGFSRDCITRCGS